MIVYMATNLTNEIYIRKTINKHIEILEEKGGSK